MNTAVVMQPVITKEFVAVMGVPVTMDGTTNQIVQVKAKLFKKRVT